MATLHRLCQWADQDGRRIRLIPVAEWDTVKGDPRMKREIPLDPHLQLAMTHLTEHPNNVQILEFLLTLASLTEWPLSDWKPGDA